MSGFRLSTEPVIFLYYSLVFINYTLLPQLLLKKICLRRNSFNETLCLDKNIPEDIHKDATKWWFVVLLSMQLPSIFTILICGPISDIIGRMKGLLCIPFIDMTGSFIFLLNAYFIGGHPAFLIPGYLFISLFGEGQGVVCLCIAFVADITKDSREHRTPQIALAEASLHLSAAFGGLGASFLRSKFGFTAVFLLSLAIDCAIFIYMRCYLSKLEAKGSSPETVSLIERSQSEEKEDLCESITETRPDVCDQNDRENEQSSGYSHDSLHSKLSYLQSYFKQMKGILKAMRETKVVLLMNVAFGLIIFGVLGEHMIQAFYLKNQPFSLSTMTIGYYVALQGFCRFIGTVIISQVSFHWFHWNDYMLMVIGSVSQVIAYVSIGLSKNTVEVFLANATSFALPLSMMSIRSVLTKNVRSNNHASVLAILGSLNVSVGMISNTISTWTHQGTLEHGGGAVYFSLATIAGIAIIVILFTYFKIARQRCDDD